MININNLFVSVEKKEILKGLNLKVNPGELLVIMGKNGTGKVVPLFKIHRISRIG